MIWSTHRLTSVVEMDEIIVISNGRAIERGSHTQLLAANGAYRKLWDDQCHKKPHNAAGQADDDNEDDRGDRRDRDDREGRRRYDRDERDDDRDNRRDDRDDDRDWRPRRYSDDR